MNDYLDGTDFEPYSFQYMKKGLHVIDQFRDQIIITELDDKSNVVTFRSTAEKILHLFYEYPKHEGIVSEKYKLIETVAKLNE